MPEGVSIIFLMLFLHILTMYELGIELELSLPLCYLGWGYWESNMKYLMPFFPWGLHFFLIVRGGGGWIYKVGVIQVSGDV